MKHTPIGLVLSTCCPLVILMHLYSRKEITSPLNIQWKLKQTSMTQISRSVYWQPLCTSLRWLKL